MAAPLYYTADRVRALPDDGNRYETVYGELLVTPSPHQLHQLVGGRLYQALANYLDQNQVGQVFYSPADISWGPDILVQPDIFVAALEEVRSGAWSDIQTLLLVVEVLSPSITRYDRFTKRRLYQQVGVPLCWVVDADARQVEVWTREAMFPAVERDRLVWRPAQASEPFTMELDKLFRPVQCILRVLRVLRVLRGLRVGDGGCRITGSEPPSSSERPCPPFPKLLPSIARP